MTNWLVGSAVDPLGDAEQLKDSGTKKNYAKVGGARPSSLMFTFGPGSIMDLPHFTALPMGLDDWERIWARRDGTPHIHAPKLLKAVREALGPQVKELRPFPHQASTSKFSDEGRDLGIPAAVFPQWFRCTGCDLLAPLTHFEYTNTNPYRPDEAAFNHQNCPGRRGEKKRNTPAVPARYLLACINGHLDEFPYDAWVHHGVPCPAGGTPTLKMLENTLGRGASATIVCASCDARRTMAEAQGEVGQRKLPRCRGRHPHLNAFDASGCGLEPTLMIVGASNLWFPILRSVIVMPSDDAERHVALVDRLRTIPPDALSLAAANPAALQGMAMMVGIDPKDVTPGALMAAAKKALGGDSADEPTTDASSPLDLLVPEWEYLRPLTGGTEQKDKASGLRLREVPRGEHLPTEITRVLALESLRQATALVGFTRIDDMERIEDQPERQAPLSREPLPWAAATLNRGEGVFLQLDEARVAPWERYVERTDLWAAYRQANHENFKNRISKTATMFDAERRLLPPRYWLLHTLSHLLIREAAMWSGYGAASISERIYAWKETDERAAAAGLILLTTSSDSDGTLGGLVELSRDETLQRIVNAALRKAGRCSSDPVCAGRIPHGTDEFLHGAACHTCSMASETSCERANRFLDRRFLVPLPNVDPRLAFFGNGDD